VNSELSTTLDIPIEMGLQSRLSIVLKVIYLLFSEGYVRHRLRLLKGDMMLEAIRDWLFLLSEMNYAIDPM